MCCYCRLSLWDKKDGRLKTLHYITIPRTGTQINIWSFYQHRGSSKIYILIFSYLILSLACTYIDPQPKRSATSLGIRWHPWQIGIHTILYIMKRSTPLSSNVTVGAVRWIFFEPSIMCQYSWSINRLGRIRGTRSTTLISHQIHLRFFEMWTLLSEIASSEI